MQKGHSLDKKQQQKTGKEKHKKKEKGSSKTVNNDKVKSVSGN